MKIGLVYEDILLYRRLLPEKDSTQKSYEEGKEELKKKLKRRTHNFDKNKETRQISYKITFRLICYEKEGYIFKRNNHFTSDYSINTSYNELHQIAQEYYYIPESSDLTYLTLFYGKKIETGFKDLGA